MRDEMVAFKLSKQERQIIEGAADVERRTISEIVRRGALEEARRVLTQRDQEQEV